MIFHRFEKRRSIHVSIISIYEDNPMTFPFGLRSSVQHAMMKVLSKLRKKEEYIILRRSVNEYFHAKPETTLLLLQRNQPQVIKSKDHRNRSHYLKQPVKRRTDDYTSTGS